MSGMKIIAFRDDGWFDPTTDFRMWDHLCRAFGVDLQMVREWSEVQVGDGGVYLVDELGEQVLEEHVIDGDGTYVFGRTHLDLFKSGIPHDGSVRIETPNAVSLFGVCAASVFLGRVQWP